MLYVVEMDFRTAGRQAEWDAWYLEHLHVLLSVPGFRSAQRFLCTTPWRAPWLAVYTVDSPAVFESDAYRTRGGRDSTGEWKPLMLNWDRNLYEGLERAPEVGPDEVLLMTEAEPEAVSAAGVAFSWLRVVGLDRTVARRGLAVVEMAHGERLVERSGCVVRAYRPVTGRLVPAESAAMPRELPS